ncbi:glycine/betaine/sarcosine/D-proline family reductase selenoprotein B [Siccirubricoccus sp. KC 17139]|uniref:Glycine/betaine/sarcosine/D-proline family reductase selenoprotein B n=2 Tax=Siccirubricoccus soli TaxID=2899147 RepID=A0ABT1D4H4_9PROT|nr:glycine/betaine/sarcosine/D-proline family reductase selenoprotein B [Siccirubricoccus soli]MCP2682960.1 glycine/betaine/sarcosine/D-proline family reductase selenoprotein B [Siccirubricoccus soli]
MATDTIDAAMGFAPDYDSPVPYMQRTREYYKAIGYDPYRWAHYIEVPFAPMTKALREARIGLITTAAPYDPAKGDQGPGAPYNSAAKFYEVYSGDTAQEHDLRISHIGYDRKHTTATDSNSWFPLHALRRAVAAGRIKEIAPRFHGAPTNRSHRHTVTKDCPELLKRVQEDQVDAVLLVPNCPVCHQTCSLAARYLEAAGIPTVVMGCAKDIVEHCGVPRFLFNDFPLGNSAGKPHDQASQDATLELALKVLESAIGPRTTVQNPQRWNADGLWKKDYYDLEAIGEAELQRRRDEFNRQKEIARSIREKAA